MTVRELRDQLNALIGNDILDREILVRKTFPKYDTDDTYTELVPASSIFVICDDPGEVELEINI